jgi:hypothetical protein
LLAFLLPLNGMHANPTGGDVTHGSATIDHSGNTLTIKQGTDRLIMGWQTFSIGQGETTRFVQPSSSSMALNRVYGGTRSMIEGRLEANGGVILINPAGITVTKSGAVNVNTFIGSTHDITDDEFLKGGPLNFKGTSDASVENLGTIHAETGDIALIARTVRNAGTVSARKGVVGLAAGDEVLYQPNAEERLLVKSQTASASSIHHSGSIQAAAAEIKAAGNPYAVAINLDGIVEARGNAARSIKPRVIVHAAQGDIKVGSTAAISAADENSGGFVKIQAATGNLQLDGKVAANSSMVNGGKGGEIQILGNNITLCGTALLDASGATGGGKIFIGGDYMGGGNPTNNYASEPLQNASTLRIDKGAVMNADATVQGDGGVVINWADGTTVSSGSVSVRGGPLGGNGGFVEISGKQNLGFDGAVDVGAVKGTPGTVLFDPAQIQITSATNLSVYSEPAINYGGTNQISYTDYSSPYVWVMSPSFFTNFTSGTIILQAYNISLEDPKGNKRANIVLNPDVNLELHSKAGGTDPKIFLPSMTETSGSSSWGDTTRSSITASGTGYVKLDASQGSQLVIHGDITTAAGDIILIAQNGIDLARAVLKSTNGGLVDITSSTGSIILKGSRIEGASGAIQITASNGSVAATYSSISNSSGPISMIGQSGFSLTGSSIQSAAGDISVNSSSGGITMYSYSPNNSVTNLIGSLIQSVSGTITLTSQNEIYLGGSTVASTRGNVSLASTASDIKLWADYYLPDGFTGAPMHSGIQSGEGNVTLNGATGITVDGANISGKTAALSAHGGAIGVGVALYVLNNASPYGSATVGSTINSGSGGLSLQAQNGIDLNSAQLGSSTGGPIDIKLFRSELTIVNSTIQTASIVRINSSGDFWLVGDGGDPVLDSYRSGTKLYGYWNYLTYYSGYVASIPKTTTPGASMLSSALASISGNIEISCTGNLNFIGKHELTYDRTDYVDLIPVGNQAVNFGPYTYNPAQVVLQKDANLTIAATGGIYMPAGSSITASGSGKMSMDASNFSLQGNILAESGNITLTSQNGIILTSATLKNTNGGTINITSSMGTITLNGSQIAGSAGPVQVTAINGNMELNAGSMITSGASNNAIMIAVGGSFANNSGPTSVSATATNGRWLIFSANPLSDTFGGLDSANDAIWDFFYDASSIITASGNRYVFASHPYAIVTVNNRTKTYGEDLSSLVLTEGSGKDFTMAPMNGVGVFTIAPADLGNVKYISSGLTSTAPVAASGYVLGVTSSLPAYLNVGTGTLTMTPALLRAGLTGTISKVYDGTTGAILTPANYLLTGVIGSDDVSLNNPPSGFYDTASVGTGKKVSIGGLKLTGSAAGNYVLLNTNASGAIGTITPATSTAQEILTEPTVQTAIQSLTIRNTTETTSSGGLFGSSESGREDSGSGGESASAGETTSSGESSSSESGGETASSESSGESGSSSESSTASTHSGSSATTASSDSASSSGSSSTAGSSSSSSSGGSASSSSGGSSQGAKAQAAAMSRMNNPVGDATVGGAEFQRLNPFSDAGSMHEEVAVSSASTVGGTTQASTGRAAAVSVKSPEMTELAPMNDLNVLFMMF